jgi:hypothetical protein
VILEVRVSVEEVEPERFPLLGGEGLSFGIGVHCGRYGFRNEV